MKKLLLLLAISCWNTRNYAQLKEQMNQYIDSIFKIDPNNPVPGLAITVIKDGSVITRKQLGMANLEHRIAFTHNTPVRLGYSGTREFMCAGLALMEANGLLKFDDKLRTYFPLLPAWSSQLTIQDLLNHSTGFDDEWATMLLMQAHMNNRVDKEQLLRFLYDQPKPQVEPGKGYMYSNSDFGLLRMIMEKACGKSLSAYLKENLFAPLGMQGTFMNDYLEEIIPGIADAYFGEGKYFKQVGVKSSPGGNYRIVTTATDLEKWALALEDSNSIASRAFKRLYQNARPIPVLSPEIHYVFGHEWQKIEGVTIIRHGGVNHDFYMTRVPSQNITIIGLANTYENMGRATKLANAWLKEKNPGIPPAPNPSKLPVSIKREDLAKLTGRYVEQTKAGHSSPIPALRFHDIKLEGDTLQFYFTSDEPFPMIPVGKNLFKDPDYGTLMEFRQSHPDSPMRMQAWPPDGSRVIELRRIQKTKNIDNPADLKKLTGQYYSKHLDYYFRILLNEKNELILRRPTISDKLLIPYGENRFLFEMDAGVDSWYVVASFTRNKKGEIDGIDLQHVRMMHHRLEKVQ